MSEELGFLTLDDIDLENKFVLVRVDINSPINPKTGMILDDSRIRKHAETISELKNSKVAILAHQSRPGKKDFTTLENHAKRLSQILGREVKYVDDIFGPKAQEKIKKLENGEILVLENVRFWSGESIKASEGDYERMAKTPLVQTLAPLFDVFVNDAFAAAHRTQPSVIGFAFVLPTVAGRIMECELKTLNKVFENPRKPSLLLLGGIKIEDKMRAIKNVLELEIADKVLTSGVLANVFLIAKGYDLGKINLSLIEKEGQLGAIAQAKELLEKYGEAIETPVDLAVFSNRRRLEVPLKEFPQENPIYDIGFETIVKYINEIKKAKTIVADGPAGVIEEKEFALGTEELLKAVATSGAFSVLGGGHLGLVAENLGIANKISHISTGGGACISLLAGEKLPVVETLKEAARKFKKLRVLTSQ